MIQDNTNSNNDSLVGYNEFEGRDDIVEIYSPDAPRCEVWETTPENIEPIRVSIPKTIKRIYSRAFANCNNLQCVTLPVSIRTIEYQAFYNCKRLELVCVENLFDESEPTGKDFIIEYGAFKNCESLEFIGLPSNVQAIGAQAFYNCKKIDYITLPEPLNHISFATFENCESLTKIKIPDSVSRIDDLAFANCKSLKNIQINNPECKFGSWVFSGCTSLKSATLPYPLTIIDFGGVVIETGSAFEEEDINLIIKHLFKNNPPEMIKLVLHNNELYRYCLVNTKKFSKEMIK